MRIGDPIVRGVDQIVKRLEKRFNAIEEIDSFDMTADGGPFALIERMAKFLRSISDVRSVHVFIEVDGTAKSVFQYPRSREPEVVAFSDQFVPKEGTVLRRTASTKENLVYLSARLASEAMPVSYFVLAESYFNRQITILHDREFMDYVTYIVGKLEARFSEALAERQLENYRSLASDFLVSDTIGLGTVSNAEQPTSPWCRILEAVYDYLPSWGPFEFVAELPRIQILTVMRGRHYLMLHAEARRRDAPATHLDLQLHRSKTVCGEILDREDAGESDEFLLRDPTDMTERYANTQFRDEKLPHSELVVPIRRNGNTVAILNLEHPEMDAFTDYHIAMTRRWVADIEAFVHFILSSVESRMTREKKFRYSLMRVAGRASKVQRHNLNNEIALASAAIYEAECAIKDGDTERALRELTKLESRNKVISEKTKGFNANIVDYISFGKKSLNRLLNDVVFDSTSRELFDNDLVKISIEPIPDDVWVYCSGLAGEHIYNLVHNSMEQFREVRRSNPKFVGTIEVGFSRIPMKDDKNNIVTPDIFEVSFLDNGGGIDRKVVEHIFEMDVSTKGHMKDGGGFGLPAAREYLRDLGGDLLLDDSAYPRGAKFLVHLPEHVEELHGPLAELMNVRSQDEEV